MISPIDLAVVNVPAIAVALCTAAAMVSCAVATTKDLSSCTVAKEILVAEAPSATAVWALACVEPTTENIPRDSAKIAIFAVDLFKFCIFIKFLFKTFCWGQDFPAY